MPADLRTITDFDALLAWLGEELDWLIADYGLDDLTFEYDAEELGLKDEEADKLAGSVIRQLRPLPGGQPFGIFFVEFGAAKLPVVVLRRVLNAGTSPTCCSSLPSGPPPTTKSPSPTSPTTPRLPNCPSCVFRAGTGRIRR